MLLCVWIHSFKSKMNSKLWTFIICSTLCVYLRWNFLFFQRIRNFADILLTYRFKIVICIGCKNEQKCIKIMPVKRCTKYQMRIDSDIYLLYIYLYTSQIFANILFLLRNRKSVCNCIWMRVREIELKSFIEIMLLLVILTIWPFIEQLKGIQPKNSIFNNISPTPTQLKILWLQKRNKNKQMHSSNPNKRKVFFFIYSSSSIHKTESHFYLLSAQSL